MAAEAPGVVIAGAVPVLGAVVVVPGVAGVVALCAKAIGATTVEPMRTVAATILRVLFILNLPFGLCFVSD
ncbi:hypothetical protein RvVAR0630_32080 [Agrobacterium vitis]|nr:hypothetical protein RvVAR0630_32080 [Agrobacterium vitis]